SQDAFPIGYGGHLTVMLRNGGHLFGHMAVDILKAVPGRERFPNFIGPDAPAWGEAGFKPTLPRQFAGKTMGRMSVKLLIQRIHFSWPKASEYLDELLFDSRSIDLLRCVRFVTKDHVVYAQDARGNTVLHPSHFRHPLLRQREGI